GFRRIELLMKFDDLIEGSGLFLGLARLIEKSDQLGCARNLFSAQSYRFVLFRWEQEGTLFFQELLGCVPPSFPFRFVENIAQQQLADLCLCRCAAEV